MTDTHDLAGPPVCGPALFLRESNQNKSKDWMVLRMEQQSNKIQPVLLSALAQLSACLIVWNFHIPNPNILLFVVLSAVLVKYGYAAGIVSGLIAFLYSAFFFSTDHSFFLYTSLNFQKLIVIGLGIAANILLIGRLQWQLKRSSMEKMQAEAEEKLQETTESYRAKLYYDVLTGAYNRRYYEDIASRIVGPAGIALMDGRFQNLQRYLWALRR